MLLEPSVARVPQGATAAAAAAAAECSCARACLATPCSCLFLVLVALEQSSDRGPVSFVFCGEIGMPCLETYSSCSSLECCSSSTQQHNNSNNRRTSEARIGCCSSAAGCRCLLLSARVFVTAWPRDMRTRLIHHVHTWCFLF